MEQKNHLKDHEDKLEGDEKEKIEAAIKELEEVNCF